jgi:hypothetical protein
MRGVTAKYAPARSFVLFKKKSDAAELDRIEVVGWFTTGLSAVVFPLGPGGDGKQDS